jgi:hypothetical protein
VEPHRDEHAAATADGDAAASRRRSAVGRSDPPGHDAGRRLRRGQRDRAQALSTVPAEAPLRSDGLRECRGGDRSLRGAHEHRGRRSAGDPVPEPADAAGLAASGLQRLLGRHRRLTVQGTGNRGRARRRRGDDRVSRGRRPLWALAVDRGSEWRSQPDSGGPLESAPPERDGRAGSGAVGGRREAVPDRELVAVSHCGSEHAHERGVHERLQRGEGARRRRRDHEHGAHARPDAHRALLDRCRRPVLEPDRARPDRGSRTAPGCSRC